MIIIKHVTNIINRTFYSLTKQLLNLISIDHFRLILTDFHVLFDIELMVLQPLQVFQEQSFIFS